MHYFIITGTSKGLGDALLKETLSRNNNFVFGLNRSKCNLKSGNYLDIRCDLAEYEQIEKAFELIYRTVSESSVESLVLINNAGIVDPIGYIQTLNSNQIENAFAVNVFGVINTTKLFIKYFSKFKSNKTIVNISSGASSKPTAGWSIYTSTKSAVEMFTKSVALEQENEEFPVKVFAFQPGKVETPMQEYVRSQSSKDLPSVDIFINSFKNKENYSPKFVAEMLIRLINDWGENGEIYKARELKERYKL
ncbi:SDR family NAD(P)-dependent oxidoreductase [bacterium]|nr:SDR family NAD(P)-dependent oxidoreductase [bacterium]